MDRPHPLFHAVHGKLVLGLLAATCLGATSSARAAGDGRDEGERDNRRARDGSKTHIAVDLDLASANEALTTELGGGGQLRLGQELDLFLISFTPELGGSYHAFSGDDRSQLYAGFLGGRLALGKIIEPALFAHVGVGHLDGSQPGIAPLLDAGLAIDFTLLPLVDLGLHGAYNVMLPRNDGTSFKFVTLGAQAALAL